MKTIYKYEIPIGYKFTMELPINVKILSVQSQNNTPYLWALIDTEETKTTRYFKLIVTGQELEENFNYKYLGTFQLNSGNFVGHLFWEDYIF